jgi:hypothetical protein
MNFTVAEGHGYPLVYIYIYSVKVAKVVGYLKHVPKICLLQTLLPLSDFLMANFCHFVTKTLKKEYSITNSLFLKNKSPKTITKLPTI